MNAHRPPPGLPPIRPAARSPATRRAAPRHRAADPVCERHPRGPSEHPPRAPGVETGAPELAGPRRRVHRLALVPDRGGDGREHLPHRPRPARAEVEGPVAVEDREMRLHRVVDVHAVARRPAIAVDDRPDALQRGAGAPGRAVLTPAPPGALSARPLAAGRVELRWQPSPGAGYHQIARSAAPGAWRPVRYAYEPGRSSFAAPAGPFRYRIKACRDPGDCSAWEELP